MSFLGIKSAGERVNEWFKSHPVLPGCDPNSLTSNCNFNGTNADWEGYRTNWVQDCASDNSGGFLESKNKTLTKCQSLFDENTKEITLSQYSNNLNEYNYLNSLLGNDNVTFYLIIFLFVGLIIYLLMSKS